MKTSADASRDTRAETRAPVEPPLRPAPTVTLGRPALAWLQLPTSLDRTRPSAQTRTSAEAERPTRAETLAETSWALAAGAEGQQAPAERGNADCALHPHVHLDLSFSDFEDVDHVTRGR